MHHSGIVEILTGFPVVKIDIYIPDYIHDHAQKLLSDPAKILMECKKTATIVPM